MTYLHNIQKVSLLFFLTIGAIHLTTGAIFFNGQETSWAGIIFRSSFLPFIICSLAYALSSLKINIYNYTGQDSSLSNIILLTTSGLVVVGMSIIFFFLPNL